MRPKIGNSKFAIRKFGFYFTSTIKYKFTKYKYRIQV